MSCRRPHLLRQIALAWAIFFLLGCDRKEAAEAGSAPELRIASLSPALTRMVVDLGLGKHLVGRTRYCDSADPSVPIVGDHFDFNAEALARVRPTVILVQPPRNDVNPALREFADKHGCELLHWKLDTLDDIRHVLRALPTELFERDSAVATAARERAGTLESELDSLLAGSDENADHWRGRVLLVHSVEPTLGIFGEGTYLDEVLAAFGCQNAARNIKGWAQLTLEDVARINPEAIIFTRKLGTQDDPIEAAGALARLPIEAARHKRIAMLTWRDAILPSTSVIETARELRAILSDFARSDS